MENLIQRYIFESFNKEEIKFINAQGIEKGGSDFDIYCVIANSVKSSVKIFKDGNHWAEIFIDTWSDMQSKISNSDEICVSFIKDMKNIFDNNNSLELAKALVPESFKLSEKRRNLIYYRIKVLYSKYKAVNTENERQYFKYLILNQLFMLTFDYSGIWPTSPKNWFSQIEKMNNSFAKQVIISQNDKLLFEEICKKEEGKFTGLEIIKESKDNTITFLG